MKRSTTRLFRALGAAALALGMLFIAAPGAGATGTPVTGDPNPPWPDACGIDAVLLIDHSNSIAHDNAANPGLMKDAAKAFADALDGTPSRLAVHSFWKTANQEIGLTDTDGPGVAAVKAAIDAIPFSTSSPEGSTNWDEAFRSVENLGARVVVILTDGNPTVYLNTYGSGSTTDQADVDEGVKSANRVKSLGLDGVASRITAVGIGGNVSVGNLQKISGPTAGDDYFTTDFAGLQTKLMEIASKICGGTVTVEKFAQNADGSFSPAAGWTFHGSIGGANPPAITADPANGTSGADGLVTFGWKSTQSREFTVSEDPKAGYALQSVDCTEGQSEVNTSAVPNGVKFTVGITAHVHCVFMNKRTDARIEVVKTAQPTSASIGESVQYGFTVTNTGNLRLTSVTLVDDRLGVITLGDTTLDPGESTSGTGSHTVVLADFPGPHVNVATATGTPPSGPAVSDTDDASVTLKTAPSIHIVKSGTAMAHPGDPVTYTFEVTNTGDVPLANVSVGDDVYGAIGVLASLGVGQSATLQYQTTAPADDVTNVGTACGTDPLNKHVCDSDDHILDVIHPNISVDKSGQGQAREGDPVTYSFLVTNTGDVTLTNVAVTDDVYGAIGTIASLAPQASQTLTKSVSAPASDTRNVATVCGSDPLQDDVCGDDDHELDIIHPGIDVTKSAVEFAHEGDEVTYTFSVHNTGDVTLTDVVVTDDVLGAIGTIPTLAPDATVDLTKTMTVPAAVDGVDNEATACGDQPNGLGELCDTDDHHLTVLHPALTLDKKVGGGDHKPAANALQAHEGNDLGYTIVVTNTGDTDLEISALTDSLNGAVADSCSKGVGDTLAPDEVMTCEYTTPAGADGAHNVADVTAVDAIGGDKGTVAASDETFVAVIDPAITIEKTADPGTVEPGEDVTYSYKVTNTGDTTLTDIVVTDDVLGEIGTIDSLEPGDSVTLTKTVTIAEDSPRINIGQACGTDAIGKQVCDTDDETIAIVLPVPPQSRPELPATGFRLFLWVAFSTVLIAAGLAMTQLHRNAQS